MEVKRLGNIFGYTGGNFAGNVYDKLSLSPTLNTTQGGNRQPMIIDNPNPKLVGGLGGINFGKQYRQWNKDSYLYLTDESNEIQQSSLRIRKLTPKEYYRLMGFDDEAFERAEQVNSNTQLYKQAGNSIVVDVLMAIFDNLLVNSRSVWLDELLEDKEKAQCQEY